MKKPKSPCATRATRARRTETPSPDILPANAPAGTKPFVMVGTWKDGFAVGIARGQVIRRALRVKNYKPALEHAGKKWAWGVEDVEFAEDGKTLLRIVARWGAKSEAEALAAMYSEAEIRRAKAAKALAAQAAGDAALQKPSSDEQDLMNARRKVMREQYPDTFKAMDAMAQAQPEARPEALEAVLRAYAVDLMRLHKPANLGELVPFALPNDTSFILEIAKAHNAKSPHKPVDQEIAARWFAAGYDKMSLPEYTKAINAKTGANLKPDAMEKRRYKKFGLMTKKPPGPPPTF